MILSYNSFTFALSSSTSSCLLRSSSSSSRLVLLALWLVVEGRVLETYGVKAAQEDEGDMGGHGPHCIAGFSTAMLRPWEGGQGGPGEAEGPVEGAAAQGKPRTKPSVRRFDNGFIIEELAIGPPNGKLASAGKRVQVRYVGRLASTGKVFDSSKGKSVFTFRLGVYMPLHKFLHLHPLSVKLFARIRRGWLPNHRGELTHVSGHHLLSHT